MSLNDLALIVIIGFFVCEIINNRKRAKAFDKLREMTERLEKEMFNDEGQI